MENFSGKCCNNFVSWEYVHLWCENDNIFQYKCFTFVTFCFSYGSKSLEYFVIVIQLCIRNLFEINYEFKKYTYTYLVSLRLLWSKCFTLDSTVLHQIAKNLKLWTPNFYHSSIQFTCVRKIKSKLKIREKFLLRF